MGKFRDGADGEFGMVLKYAFAETEVRLLGSMLCTCRPIPLQELLSHHLAVHDQAGGEQLLVAP